MTALKSALISVFNKEGLTPIVKKLSEMGVTIYSTGGTAEFIRSLDIAVQAVEHLTDYPSILGGRVKTLHPKVFGGILGRRDLADDVAQLEAYDIPPIDLVLVDLYPFEETVLSGSNEKEIIEKIDIGGVSLIRAAAKNFQDVLTIPCKKFYPWLLDVLQDHGGQTTVEQRKEMATKSFDITSHYDSAIYKHFSTSLKVPSLKISESNYMPLRYGENPHQNGRFYGDIEELFDQLHGKDLSYNNLLDIDAAIHLMREFDTAEATFIILKHNNACGVATRKVLLNAFEDALAGDPVSAFGGVLIANKPIDKKTAEAIDELFCEVLISPGFDAVAFDILKSKKKRILLVQKSAKVPAVTLRSTLNGILWQEKDEDTDEREKFTFVTEQKPEISQLADLEFASKICKHTKSNTIVLVKNEQLLGSGTGQTSRIDALRQAIAKARAFSFDLTDAVMASDAFFPFPDCVEIAHDAGIKTVIQPGGSIKDHLSIKYCNENGVAMVFTGARHFKH